MTAQAHTYSAETVQAVLDAAFAGAVPERVDALIDRKRLAQNSESGRLAVSWRVAGGAPETWVRAVSKSDYGALRAKVAAIWPGIQPWFDRFSDAFADIEFNGEDVLFVYFTGIDRPADAEAPPDAHVVGVMVTLRGPNGEWGLSYDAITMHATPPVEHLTPRLRAEAEVILAAGGEGLWFCQWHGGKADVLAWASEAPSTEGAAAVLARLPRPPTADAVIAAISATGLEACPLEARWYESGETLFHVTGARAPAALEWNEPAIFTAGSAPDPVAFADTVAAILAAGDRASGHALVVDHLHPGLAATVPAGTDPSAWFRAAWQHLFGRMAAEPPFLRLQTLQIAAASCHLAALDQEAYELGLARYLQTHPSVERPEGELSDAVAALDAEGVQARADVLLAEARAMADLLATVGGADVDPLRQVPGLHPNAEAIVDTLERAVSGAFQAASGRLHDWIFVLGPAAFDNDPTLPKLNELDPETFHEVAIEEVLKAGVDDMGDDDL
jgi:hypothetical protein